MIANRFLMAAVTVASLCFPISGANACFVALADASAISGGGSAADRSAAARESGTSDIKAAARGPSPGKKSEKKAILSSLLGTGVPACAAVIVSASGGSGAIYGTLGLTSYVIGPSIGHFYARRAGRAFIGIGIRGVALVGVAAAIIAALSEDRTNDPTALAIGSLVVGGGSVLFDIVDAPHSARVHNRQARTPLTISPAAVGDAPGVRVDVRM